MEGGGGGVRVGGTYRARSTAQTIKERQVVLSFRQKRLEFESVKEREDYI